MVRAENELPTIMNLRAHCVALCIMENDTHTHTECRAKKNGTTMSYLRAISIVTSDCADDSCVFKRDRQTHTQHSVYCISYAHYYTFFVLCFTSSYITCDHVTFRNSFCWTIYAAYVSCF